MSLRERFEILGLKRDDGARSFEAREIATGRPVLVHLLPVESPLLKRVAALPDSERGRVLDRGEEAGEIYLITDRLAEFPGLSEWLHQGAPKTLSQGGAWQIKVPEGSPPAPRNPAVDKQLASMFDSPPPVPAPTLQSAPILTDTGEITMQMPAPVIVPEAEAPAAPSSPPQAPPANVPGEFTQQFAPVLRPVSVKPPAPPPVSQPPENPAPENQPGENQPGEFTRQFSPVIRPVSVKRPVPPANQSTANQAPANQPGEFTREFSPVVRPVSVKRPEPPPNQPPANQPGEFTREFAPVLRPIPTPVAKPEQPPASNEPGEFTKLFQRPTLRPPAPPAPPEPAPPAPSTNPAGPGEFTQMLQAQRPAGSPAPAPLSTSQENEFAKFFQSPMAPSPMTPGGAPLAPPIPPRQNFQPGNAGEFTQVFGVGDIPAPPPPLRPPPPPVAPISPEATQAFEKSRTPAFTPKVPSGSMPQAPAPPGEYTRQFSAPAPLTFGQPSSVPQVPRAPVSFSPAPGSFSPVRKQSHLPLILIVSAVVLLAAALLVYFVMRSHAA